MASKVARHHGRSRSKGSHRRFSDFPFPNINLPPPGTYDPGLGAQIRQSQRGLLDLIQDVHRTGRQARLDTRTARRQAARTKTRSLGDIKYERQGTRLSFTQDLQDLARAQQRGTEDYQTALGNLGRKYTNLASAQTQSANARGVLEGGYAAASAQRRAENQAIEAQPINTAQQRLLEDVGTKRGRAQEEFQRQLGHYQTLGQRTRQDFHSQLTQIHRSLKRTLAENRIKRSRAIREQGLYALDQAQQAFYAAHQQDPTMHFPSLQQIRQRSQ